MTKNYNLMENLTIKFSIFDIAGQKYFRKVRKQYYRGSQAIIYVYDVTRKETLDGIKKWRDDVESVLEGQELKSLLIGNKIDLENQRQVDMMEGKSFADEMGLPYIETSAKNGTNVDKAFGRIATKLAIDNMIIS